MEVRPFGIDVVVFQPGNHDTAFGTNVVAVLPPDSPYASLAAAALPKISGWASTPGRPSRPAAGCATSWRRRGHRCGSGSDPMTTRPPASSRLAPYALRRRGVQFITGLGAAKPAPAREEPISA